MVPGHGKTRRQLWGMTTLDVCLTACDGVGTMQGLSKVASLLACSRPAASSAVVPCLQALQWAALPDLRLCPALQSLTAKHRLNYMERRQQVETQNLNHIAGAASGNAPC